MVAFVIVGVLLGDALTTEGEVTSPTDSKRAEELVAEHFPVSPDASDRATTEVVIVSFAPGEVDTARVDALAEDLRQAGAATVVTRPTRASGCSSEDGSAAALLVGLGADEDRIQDVVAAVERLDEQPGVEAAMTGELTVDEDFTKLSEEDLQQG